MGEPRYRVIAADLAAKIRSGTYPPGTALPAQRELGAQYQVALATIRQSLQALSDDGLVVVEAGRGTFAAPIQPAYRLDTLRSFVEDLNDQGHQVETTVVACGLRKPPAAVVAQLALGEPAGGLSADRVLRLERVRSLAGVPAIHQVSWVAQPHAGVVQTIDFGQISLYGALTAAGVSLVRASERVLAAGLTRDSAGLLGRPEGSAAFVSERTTFALDGAAVVFDRAMIVGKLMEIRATRTTTRVSVAWGSADL